MATDVLALDIETKNLSHEIGGWGNTHMFLVSTVATWDGNVCKVYVDEEVTDSLSKSGYEAFSLRQLKYDLDDHFEKGGYLLGHNIASFDLPVLRDSVDIFCINKYIDGKKYIDTSRELTKQFGERFRLQNLVDHTLGETKSLESHEAPGLWKAGEYDVVVDYCIKDTKLVYDLWKSGKEKPLSAFSIEKEELIELEVNW